MLIAMNVGATARILPEEAVEGVDTRLWERTMEVVRSHSGYASR